MKNTTEEMAPVRDTWKILMSYPELTAFCVPSGLLAIVIVFGNVLVIMAFIKTTNLRNHVNYFVVGLAIADILVGMISLPMWILLLVIQWKGQPMPGYATNLSLLFDTLDSFAAINSILHLMAISLERFFATAYPIKHRGTSKRFYRYSVLLIWLVSLLLACSKLLPSSEVLKKSRLYLISLVFILPLIVICAAYISIWFKVRKRFLSGRGSAALDPAVRMALTLLIVIGLFVVAWLPFFVVRLVLNHCNGFCVSWRLFYAVKMLHFSNSAVNPLVYGLRVPEYRKTFSKFLLFSTKFKCRRLKCSKKEIALLEITDEGRSRLQQEGENSNELSHGHVRRWSFPLPLLVERQGTTERTLYISTVVSE